MSPNSNYISGRNFEYETMRTYEQRGFACIRASGSHGDFDVVAYHTDRKPVFIQCKVVEKASLGTKMAKDFKKETRPAEHYHQALAVKVKRQGITETIV